MSFSDICPFYRPYRQGKRPKKQSIAQPVVIFSLAMPKESAIKKVRKPRQNKQVGSQEKKIIARVYHRMKYEAQNGVEKIKDARWRTAQACGVSESTISRVLREERAAVLSPDFKEPIFKDPSRNRSRICTKSELYHFDMEVLRKTISRFHIDYNELPTLRKLKQALGELIGFDGCVETLRLMLQKAGFEWCKAENNQYALVEKHDIQMIRFNYLKQLQRFRIEGRYIVYTDVHTVHTQNILRKEEDTDVLQDTSTTDLQQSHKKLPKQSGLIIMHAGGSEGFVPNALLSYEANSNSGGNQDVNYDSYKSWLISQLLPNLPERAVIVMEGAPYHNTLNEDIPSPTSNKKVMQKWLNDKNIKYGDSMKKIELYDIIVKNKERFQTYAIDEIIRAQGFEILRLPPYHPELNAIKKIWGLLNNYVSNEQNITSITTLINNHIQMIDSNMWANTCQHVQETEHKYMEFYDMDYQ